MSGARIKKINELLKEEVGSILKEEIDLDDGILLTITRVDTSPTLEHSEIGISIFPESEIDAVLNKLKENIYNIQQKLNKRLTLRKVPKIKFEIDRTEKNASRIEKIIDSIEQE